MENLPDDILATIGSYIAINPTLKDRKLKLWGKWADIFFNNRTKQEWLEKISKNPHFYGYRSFKVCNKIIKFEHQGLVGRRQKPIEDWKPTYAEKHLLASLGYTYERLDGCSKKVYLCGFRSIW